MGPKVRLEGWLRWFAHPFGDVCRGHEPYPVFAPDSSNLAVGLFLFVCFFGPFVQNLPQPCKHAVTFGPTFLVFCSSGEVCLGIALQQRPQVPAHLRPACPACV